MSRGVCQVPWQPLPSSAQRRIGTSARPSLPIFGDHRCREGRPSPRGLSPACRFSQDPFLHGELAHHEFIDPSEGVAFEVDGIEKLDELDQGLVRDFLVLLGSASVSSGLVVSMSAVALLRARPIFEPSGRSRRWKKRASGVR